jgi:hypothetical protein
MKPGRRLVAASARAVPSTSPTFLRPDTTARPPLAVARGHKAAGALRRPEGSVLVVEIALTRGDHADLFAFPESLGDDPSHRSGVSG